MKAKIIMLRATKNNYGIIEDLYLNPGELVVPQPHGDKVKYHNFYLIDPNAEIKEGDYRINYEINKVEQYKNVLDSLYCEDCSKIIATTDSSLGKYIDGNNPEIGEFIGVSLPQLSEQSIQLLIDYYNREGKMPDEVEVGMYEGNALYNYGKKVSSKEYIKLNPQGTVDITIPEEVFFKNSEGINHLKWIFDRLVNVHGENPNYDYMQKLKSISEKKTYTKKEVKSLIIKFKEDNFKHLNISTIKLNEMKWFNKNL